MGIAIAVVVVVVLLLVARSMRIASEWQRAVILRLGLEHHLDLEEGALELTIEGTVCRLSAGDCLRYKLMGASRFRAAAVAVRHHHRAGAFRDEALAQRGTDTARPSGHDHDTIANFRVGSLP